MGMSESTGETGRSRLGHEVTKSAGLSLGAFSFDARFRLSSFRFSGAMAEQSYIILLIVRTFLLA